MGRLRINTSQAYLHCLIPKLRQSSGRAQCDRIQRHLCTNHSPPEDTTGLPVNMHPSFIQLTFVDLGIS